MSAGPAPHVRLANEIAVQFAHVPPTTAAARIARHIHDFWDPRMIRALLAAVDAGTTDLDPLVVEAAGRLRQYA